MQPVLQDSDDDDEHQVSATPSHGRSPASSARSQSSSPPAAPAQVDRYRVPVMYGGPRPGGRVPGRPLGSSVHGARLDDDSEEEEEEEDDRGRGARDRDSVQQVRYAAGSSLSGISNVARGVPIGGPIFGRAMHSTAGSDDGDSQDETGSRSAGLDSALRDAMAQDYDGLSARRQEIKMPFLGGRDGFYRPAQMGWKQSADRAEWQGVTLAHAVSINVPANLFDQNGSKRSFTQLKISFDKPDMKADGEHRVLVNAARTRATLLGFLYGNGEGRISNGSHMQGQGDADPGGNGAGGVGGARFGNAMGNSRAAPAVPSVFDTSIASYTMPDSVTGAHGRPTPVPMFCYVLEYLLGAPGGRHQGEVVGYRVHKIVTDPQHRDSYGMACQLQRHREWNGKVALGSTDTRKRKGYSANEDQLLLQRHRENNTHPWRLMQLTDSQTQLARLLFSYDGGHGRHIGLHTGLTSNFIEEPLGANGMDVSSHLLSLERACNPWTRTNVASLYDRAGMPEDVKRDTVGASPRRGDADGSDDDEDAMHAPSAYQASFNPLRAGLDGCDVHPAQLDPANYYSVEAGVFCPPYISPLHERPLPSAQGAVDVFFVPDTPGGINLLLTDLPAPPSSHSNLGEPLVAAYKRVLRARPPPGVQPSDVPRMRDAEVSRHLEAAVRGYRDEADAPGHESAGEAYRRATHCPNPRLVNPEGESATSRMNVVTGRVEREDVLKTTREEGLRLYRVVREAHELRVDDALDAASLEAEQQQQQQLDDEEEEERCERILSRHLARENCLHRQATYSMVSFGLQTVNDVYESRPQLLPNGLRARLHAGFRAFFEHGGDMCAADMCFRLTDEKLSPFGHRMQLDLAHGRMLGIEGADAGHVLPTLLSHTFGACLDTEEGRQVLALYNTEPSTGKSTYTTSALPKMVPECVVRPSGYESARSGTTGDAVSDMFTLTYDEAQTQFLGDQSGRNPVAAEKQEAMKTKLSLKRVDVARPEYRESADGTRKLEEHRIETKHREAMVMTMNKTRLLGATAHTLGEQMPMITRLRALVIRKPGSRGGARGFRSKVDAARQQNRTFARSQAQMMLLDFFTTWGLYCYNTLPAFRSLDERFAVDHFSELDRQMTAQFGLPYPTDREREARLEMLRVHLIRNAAWCAFFVVQPDDPDLDKRRDALRRAALFEASDAAQAAASSSSSAASSAPRGAPPRECPFDALHLRLMLPYLRPDPDKFLEIIHWVYSLSCLIRHVHVHDAIALTIAHAVGIEHDAGTKQWVRDPMSDDANASCGERFCGATNYYAVAPPASGLLADAVSTNPQLGKVNAQLCALESQRMSVSRGRRVVLQASSAPDAVSGLSDSSWAYVRTMYGTQAIENAIRDHGVAGLGMGEMRWRDYNSCHLRFAKVQQAYEQPAAQPKERAGSSKVQYDQQWLTHPLLECATAKGVMENIMRHSRKGHRILEQNYHIPQEVAADELLMIERDYTVFVPRTSPSERYVTLSSYHDPVQGGAGGAGDTDACNHGAQFSDDEDALVPAVVTPAAGLGNGKAKQPTLEAVGMRPSKLDVTFKTLLKDSDRFAPLGAEIADSANNVRQHFDELQAQDPLQGNCMEEKALKWEKVTTRRSADEGGGTDTSYQLKVNRHKFLETALCWNAARLDALLHLDGFCKEVDGRWYPLNERGETTNDGCPDSIFLMLIYRLRHVINRVRPAGAGKTHTVLPFVVPRNDFELLNVALDAKPAPDRDVVMGDAADAAASRADVGTSSAAPRGAGPSGAAPSGGHAPSPGAGSHTQRHMDHDMHVFVHGGECSLEETAALNAAIDSRVEQRPNTLDEHIERCVAWHVNWGQLDPYSSDALDATGANSGASLLPAALRVAMKKNASQTWSSLRQTATSAEGTGVGAGVRGGRGGDAGSADAARMHGNFRGHGSGQESLRKRMRSGFASSGIRPSTLRAASNAVRQMIDPDTGI